MKNEGLNKSKTTLAAVFTVAGVLYCLISLVNHYLFKTYALDLGLYTHFMYEYAHFRRADLFMLDMAPQSALSAHFDLYLIILSPLVYVFGTYTLLIVQIAAVLLGGWGVYKLIGLYTDDDWLPILAAATFLFSFGIIHPFGFDYHSNVVATMMMPWMLYYLKKGRYGLSALFAILLVMGKENLSLWLVFIALGLIWDYRKDKKALWYLTGCALFATAYFVVVNMLILPQLGARGIMRYEYLGNNYLEIAKNLLTHPSEAIKILFTNTLGKPHYDGIKEEFYICALLTGMAFTLLKPNYLFMLIPLIAQKMLSAERMFWGVSLQYSVEFMPVLVVSSYLVILRLKRQLPQWILAGALLLSTVLTSFYTTGVPKSYIVVDQLCVYQGRHYEQKSFDAAYARELINQIPDDAYVCAATMFVPHLALRHHIEDFASNRNTEAEYVLITKPYFDISQFGVPIFGNRDDFETIATDGTLYLLHRKQP